MKEAKQAVALSEVKSFLGGCTKILIENNVYWLNYKVILFFTVDVAT